MAKKRFNKQVRRLIGSEIVIHENDTIEVKKQKLSQLLNVLTMQLNLLSIGSQNNKEVVSKATFCQNTSLGEFFCDPSPITKTGGVLLKDEEFADGLDKMTGLVLIKRMSDLITSRKGEFRSSVSRFFDNGISRNNYVCRDAKLKVYDACMFHIGAEEIIKEWPGFEPCINGARELSKIQDKYSLNWAVEELRLGSRYEAFATLWANWKNGGSAGFGPFYPSMFKKFDEIIFNNPNLPHGIHDAFTWLITLLSNPIEQETQLPFSSSQKKAQNQEIGRAHV